MSAKTKMTHAENENPNRYVINISIDVIFSMPYITNQINRPDRVVLHSQIFLQVKVGTILRFSWVLDFDF